jgi:hypothetical protein
MKESQKTAHILVLREVLMLKYTTFNLGNNITCGADCTYRTAATLHILDTWFVSGI